MKHLILVRHGNTFGPGDKVVWVGKQNNLPLVESGQEQAKRVGQALRESPFRYTALHSGPLVRAQETAALIVESLQLPLAIQVDERLDEIDYGIWSGKSNQEIAESFSQKPMDEWSSGLWQSEYFQGSEEEVCKGVASFADSVSKHCADGETVIAVSSNGTLRYFQRLFEGSFEAAIAKGVLKVKTGNLCLLQFSEDRWQVQLWDITPEDFPKAVSHIG